MRYYLNPLMITVIIGLIYIFVFVFKEIRRFANTKADETKDMTNNELYRQILILFIVLSALIVFRH